ncbi:VPS37 C-terminal domain-containing protein [Aphelenchoides fujianensis]|nr:VPS37 C-terminal domain-containing protein [Aphelenchoides fujianensis]
MTSSLEEMIEIYKRSIHRDIQQWDNEKLEELLKDERQAGRADQRPITSAFHFFCSLHSLFSSLLQALKVLTDLRNDRLRLCKMFAESNLSMKPQFEELRETVGSKAEEVKRLEKEVKRLKKELDTMADSRSLDNVASAYESFEGGRMNVDEFIAQFTKRRELYHVRKVKYDKLTEILRQQRYNIR